MPAGASAGPGIPPDKRTTAYENIFGRPTAKPKGPQPLVHNGQPHRPQAGSYSLNQRWNAAAPVPTPAYPIYGQGYGELPQVSVNPYYGGGNYNAIGSAEAGFHQEPIDRRSSVTPSVSSSDPRMSVSSGGYYPVAGVSAADAYRAPATGPTAASAYASYYMSGAGGGAGYSNPNAHSPTSAHQGLPPTNRAESNTSSTVSTPAPSRPDSVGGGHTESRPPPRLPSIEFSRNRESIGKDEFWFDSEGGRKTPTSPRNGGSSTFGNSHPAQSTSGSQSVSHAATQLAEDDRQSTYAPEEAYMNGFSTDAMFGRDSAASSIYEGGRRRGSFESDRQSIANSVYTLPGTQSASRSFYSQSGSGNPNPALNGSGYFPPPPSMSALTPYGPSTAWDRPPRARTTSTATQAAQAAYAPGYANQSADWRESSELPRGGPGGRTDQRSMSFGQATRPTALTAPTSPHGSITGGKAPIQAAPRKGPLVYPALLSKVAEAFKARVTLSERTKDGLTYSDAFDGREAVDRIAYIIKTTDRNLALLLGRALDAQKFFHDVTYDHRLRDSPNEIYQFRVTIPNTFSNEDAVYDERADPAYAQQKLLPGTGSQSRENSATSLVPHSSASSAASIRTTANGSARTGLATTPATSVHQNQGDLEEEDMLPTGVFTLLTDCYSPTCTRDKLCYSIACPRRLEQQARLNMKPQPGLKRSVSKESLGDTKERGTLWAESVSKDVFDSLDDTERKRQEAINEVIYTERDFVADLEYLRDCWIKPLRSKDIIPEERRDDFVTQVFWNVLEIHAVNAKLSELLNKRQKQQAVVDRLGDILLEMVPHFQPFVKYGAHQLYGKYEFEKEKASNQAFAKFVDETERLPQSRKLELNGYLTKPTTRLARYPLLLEQVIKYTPEENSDKQTLPRVVKIVKEFLSKVNVETGKSENRFNLAQLDQQLVFKQGEAVDLRLRDEQRELVFKGPLKKRGGTQSESAELQVFLFDHALLMVKAKTVHKHDLYKVYRKPIPLELLIVTVYDEVPTGKGNATRPKSVMSRTSTGNRISGTSTGAAPKQDAKTGYALTFTYLGRKGYSMTLWASTFVSRRKWFEHIEARQEILRQRSNIFDTITLSEGFFTGANKVNCSVPFDFGRRIIYGTEDGVYLSDLREKARPPTKVLPLPGVTQVDVLEEYQILIVLAERSVHTFTLDALDPSDPMGSLKRGRRISSHTSFFRAGICLGRTLVCVVKSSSLSSTIKTLEPIEQNVRGKKQPTFRKLLQGGQETLRVFKEFYIPTESSSIHFLKHKLCVGCTKGFEIVDLETLDTQGLLDPADPSLDFVQRKENVKPIAIYRIGKEFLLCYDEFAFYVNSIGWRAKNNWIIHWEGNPTSFAYHHPYVLAFEPSFVEVRHVETGALHQVITGVNLRCLFADVAPPASSVQSHSASSSSMSLHSNASYGSLSGGHPHQVAPYVRPPPHMSAPPPPFPGQGYLVQRPPSPFVPPGANAYPSRSPIPTPPPGSPYGMPPPPSPQVMPYARPPPGMPYALPPPRLAQVQRNPVWESVAASRNQIVFIGDTTVFCVRLHSESSAKSNSNNGNNNGSQSPSASSPHPPSNGAVRA
ncbi:CNH-domain-containing protein [Violaceomyces palustris]|uniref:CNH-domain-containing protein n=1 Tax=Violaceomyces palustris TaxID=1673888 RepID=A0ACD0NRP4_9BASI|nr:CNH-domain-containing protein [Violaceomyces palustris]